MLFDAAGVTRSLGGLLSVLTDRLFEFFGHRVLSQWQQMVAYLESYPVDVQSDGNGGKISARVISAVCRSLFGRIEMSEKSIGSVLFEKRAKFYHAANLRDFRTYCQRRELLARSELTTNPDGYTPFYSDATDQQRNVWNRVFGNLQDYNGLFWANKGCVPNAYGPITMVFGRAVWKASDDIAVTRENAATEGYELDACRMDADELEKCYVKNDKWWQLKCYGLEVSFGATTLAFEDIEKIIVDPVTDNFINQVRDVWICAGGEASDVVARSVRNQPPNPEDLAVYRDLVDWAQRLAGIVPTSSDLRKAVPSCLSEWASKLNDSLWGPLRQWLEYIYNGTLQ